MQKKDIIVFVAVAIFLAFRLYQRYTKKKNQNTDTAANTNTGSGFPSSSKDDDYEPYSKR